MPLRQPETELIDKADTSAPLPRAAALIVNTRSRRGRKLFREARAQLTANGIALVRAVPLRDPRGLKAEVTAAIADGANMVIVGGGDGSISGSVDCLVGKDCVYALLPLGTANSFARTLGISLDLEGAIDVIANGRRARIDLGMIDGDYFANVAAIGMPSLVAATIPDPLKGAVGRLGYILWAGWCLTRFRPFDVRLTSEDGKTTEYRALELRIANGSYLGGTEITEEAEVDSGHILVQVVTGGSVISLGWNWLATLLKLPQRKQTIETIKFRSVRIETDPPLPVSIDGEVDAKTPLTASVAKGIIEIAVPADN